MLSINQIVSRKGLVAACVSLLLAAFTASAVQAKTVSDPNHKGWTGKHPRSKMVQWKPIKVKCEKCSKMAEQYNAAAQQLLNSRYWVHFWREVQENREKGKTDPFWPGKGDINEFEAKAVAANLDLMENQLAQLELHKKMVRQLERQLSYLAAAIQECERSQCQAKKPSKIKGIKIGGATTRTPFAPDAIAIMKSHGINWQGPYRTNCQPCVPFAVQLNALPGWVVKAQMRLEAAENRLAYARLRDKSNEIKLDFLKYTHPDKTDYSHLKQQVDTIKQELKSYQNYFHQLLKKLKECEQKMCPPKLNDNVSYVPITTCPVPSAETSITVGANNEVGSKANFKEKAKNKAAGIATKAITGLLGIGGGGGGKADGPGTYKDPVKNKQKINVKSNKPRRELHAGAVFTADGLLVSTNIKRAPGKGTFQTIYLENPRGWRLVPIALFMYEIWKDWKLSVSWTRDTYVNGEHVKHEQGGWTESWRELVAKGEEVIYGEVLDQAVWEQLGFSTAVSGAKSIGTLFPVTPEMLAAEPINLVVHVTQPKADPVVTLPYIFELSLGKKGRVVIKQVDKTQAAQGAPCQEKGGVTAIASPAVQHNASSGVAPILAQAVEPAKARQNGDGNNKQDNSDNSPGKDSNIDGDNPTPGTAVNQGKDPCTNECKTLLKDANEKASLASKLQSAADTAQQNASDADSAATEAEAAADKADDLAKELPRDDHAIINGHKYTTADTEYRVMLQGKINQAHRDGKISDAEHERQTKANTNKKAQEERLKNLAKLRKEAAAARAKANAARQQAALAAKAAADAQAKANVAKADAAKAKQAYQDCLAQAKQECERIKAAEAKRAAAAKVAEEQLIAAEQQAARDKAREEKRAADREAQRQANLAEEKRLLALIKELGLIDKKVSEVPSLWQALPDILEVPVAMFTEVKTGVPIPVDTIGALGGLYGILGAMLNPCTAAGMLKTELRLREMINAKTGKKYTEAEAAKETAAMCSLLGKLRGRIAALKRAGNK